MKELDGFSKTFVAGVGVEQDCEGKGEREQGYGQPRRELPGGTSSRSPMHAVWEVFLRLPCCLLHEPYSEKAFAAFAVGLAGRSEQEPLCCSLYPLPGMYCEVPPGH